MRFAPAAGQLLTNAVPRRRLGRSTVAAVQVLATLGLALLWPTPLRAAELANAATAQPQIDFGRDIQPILARRCFACHGPDKAEAGLRLNRREAAVAPLESGTVAVVPGKPDESEMLRRIGSTDADERACPRETGP